MRLRSSLLATSALVLALTACAAAGPETPGAEQGAAVTPTAACPQQPGVELPPECAPYDPEQAMRQNDAYRERIDMDAAATETNERTIPAVTANLEAARAAGIPLTETSVETALADAGLIAVQLRGGDGAFLFGAAAPAGGCVYGEVGPATLIVEVGGIIMDGGCLPAQ